jgi:hypothetical protein
LTSEFPTSVLLTSAISTLALSTEALSTSANRIWSCCSETYHNFTMSLFRTVIKILLHF